MKNYVIQVFKYYIMHKNLARVFLIYNLKMASQFFFYSGLTRYEFYYLYLVLQTQQNSLKEGIQLQFMVWKPQKLIIGTCGKHIKNMFLAKKECCFAICIKVKQDLKNKLLILIFSSLILLKLAMILEADVFFLQK